MGDLVMSMATALSAGTRAVGLLGTALMVGLIWTTPTGLVLVLVGKVDAVATPPWVFLWAGATFVAGVVTLDRIRARERH